MKLEVPHLRIMRGEAANLSPTASKVLLILIACQDQFTKTIQWSKTRLAEITGLPCRSIYRALTELNEKNWITRNHQIIQLITTQANSDATVTTRMNSDADVSITANPTDTTGSFPDTTVTQTATALAHNQDQIDLKDHDSNRKTSLVMTIGEKYNLTPSKYRQLWSICEKADFKKLQGIFEAMINHKSTINDPVAYIMVSLGNNGSSQKSFDDFLSTHPD